MPISEEELNPHAQDDLSVRAYPLESLNHVYPVSYDPVNDASKSEFCYFQDGRQRTVQIGFIPARVGGDQLLIPVHYFVVAAAILSREGRSLKLWGQPVMHQGILVERSLLPDQSALSEIESLGLTIEGTDAHGGDYYDLRRKALQRAKDLRLDAEKLLIAKWATATRGEPGFLVVDGTLMNFRDEESTERCVGVSKSFGSRYFPMGDHNRVMSMPTFHRSWTFKFHGEDGDNEDPRLGGRERVSWYLRIRERTNRDPEFGMIRVEISKRHAENAPEFADRLSRSLISERLPTAYPTPRWDNHLYPIKSCENYLSSVMPSLQTITASMKGGIAS